MEREKAIEAFRMAAMAVSNLWYALSKLEDEIGVEVEIEIEDIVPFTEIDSLNGADFDVLLESLGVSLGQ